MLASQKQINQSLIADGIAPNDNCQIPKSYWDGEFDEKIGLDAAYPEDWDYYSRWAMGHREYKCQRKGITLHDSF